MDSKTLMLLEELLEHIKSIEGEDFKMGMDKSMAPKEEMPMEVEASQPESMAIEEGVMPEKAQAEIAVSDGGMPGEEEMTDEELEALMRSLS